MRYLCLSFFLTDAPHSLLLSAFQGKSCPDETFDQAAIFLETNDYNNTGSCAPNFQRSGPFPPVQVCTRDGIERRWSGTVDNQCESKISVRFQAENRLLTLIAPP